MVLSVESGDVGLVGRIRLRVVHRPIEVFDRQISTLQSAACPDPGAFVAEIWTLLVHMHIFWRV